MRSRWFERAVVRRARGGPGVCGEGGADARARARGESEAPARAERDGSRRLAVGAAGGEDGPGEEALTRGEKVLPTLVLVRALGEEDALLLLAAQLDVLVQGGVARRLLRNGDRAPRLLLGAGEEAVEVVVLVADGHVEGTAERVEEVVDLHAY